MSSFDSSRPTGPGNDFPGSDPLVRAPGEASPSPTPSPNGLALPATPTGDAAARLLLEQLLGNLTNGPDPEEERRSTKRWQWRTYTAAMRRRLRPMLLAALVVTLVVAWRLRPTVTQYSATTVMLLPKNSGQSADPLGILGSIMSSSMPNNLQTQIAILTSPGLVKEALKTLSPQEMALGWKTLDLDEAIPLARVQALPGQSGDLITLTVTANDPTVAVKLANQLVDTFGKRSTVLAGRTSQKNLKLLREQVKQSYALMVKAKEELKQFKQRTGILNLPTKLASDSAQAQELTLASRRAREAVTAGVADPAVQSDETRNNLRQALRAAQDRYSDVLKDFLPSAPEAQKVAREVREARAALDLRTQALLDINRSRMRDADQALAAQRKAMESLPATEVRLGQLQDQVDLLTNTYKTVYDRYTALSLGQSAQIDTATSLIPADKALLASRTWPMILTVSLMCGLACAVLVAAALETADHSVHETDDLRGLLDSPVLGSLPLLGKNSERRLPYLQPADKTAGPLLESCRLLRANLYFAAGGGLKSVLVTSADPGEGKSLSAYNMAAAIALDGRRVLVLDCDLRRPTQHDLNHAPLEPGLVDLLGAGDDLPAQIDAALRPGPVQNMWVITAGSLTGHPPELLGSEANRRLMAELEQRFDLIILDSPPVLSLADAQVLASLADGVLLVVAADVTPAERVQRADMMLRHAGARVLGTVLNQAREHQDMYAIRGYYSQPAAYPAFGPDSASGGTDARGVNPGFRK